jgi:hypothetical protein
MIAVAATEVEPALGRHALEQRRLAGAVLADNDRHRLLKGQLQLAAAKGRDVEGIFLRFTRSSMKLRLLRNGAISELGFEE